MTEAQRGGEQRLKVLVCGGRHYPYKRKVFDALDKIPVLRVIHGGCPTGADRFADQWADATDHSKEIYRANWIKYGKAAGPIRNQQMLDEGKPNLVVAFHGGRGTADMVARAKAANVTVWEIP